MPIKIGNYYKGGSERFLRNHPQKEDEKLKIGNIVSRMINLE